MNIAKLVGFYYRTLVDHHKDRDCHFSINKRWSYGNEPKYQVEHNGYINEFFEEFDTNAEAEKYLADKLIELVRSEIEHWKNAKAVHTDIFGYNQEEIDRNRGYMLELEKELNEFTKPNHQ